MHTPIRHDLKIAKSRDARSRENFVATLRGHVLNTMANSMRSEYDTTVLPAYEREHGKAPEDGADVHKAMRADPYFRFYSTVRCNAQQMVWNAVIDSVETQADTLTELSTSMSADQARAQGTLELDPDLVVPEYVSAVDVHLMPGNYTAEASDTDVAAGSIYDNGLSVFSFGAMGEELSDIGWTMANFARLRFPDLNPARILDVGCTIGHNTVPWKQTFPDAEVHGIDVAAPCLRYGHARAQALGQTVHFHQRSGEDTGFEDGSFDVVFSSMFLHELPAKAIAKYLAEAHRLLRPGGIMLNMELPPNNVMSPYDAFYLDWDSYYNNEPFYKPFRDQDPKTLCADAGFDADSYFEGVMPRYTYVDEAVFKSAVTGDAAFDDSTGRLSDSIQWYGFGAVRT
jgi:ubiquinone/menaquinone biosynthesis C-methylase UbiE